MGHQAFDLCHYLACRRVISARVPMGAPCCTHCDRCTSPSTPINTIPKGYECQKRPPKRGVFGHGTGSKSTNPFTFSPSEKNPTTLPALLIPLMVVPITTLNAAVCDEPAAS
jgi:hypothetical protein